MGIMKCKIVPYKKLKEKLCKICWLHAEDHLRPCVKRTLVRINVAKNVNSLTRLGESLLYQSETESGILMFC